MSWVATAIAVTATTAGVVSANQTKQRNKGYIEDSFQTAQQRLKLKQQYGREDAGEALAARGLTAGGDVNASPIATAMVNGKMTATGAAPHTLGAQQTSDNAVQMGLETQDLEQQHSRAQIENKAQYTNAIIGSLINGAESGASIYGARQESAAGGPGVSWNGVGNPADASAGGAQGVSRIGAAMQPSFSGVGNPGNWFGGVHGNDPLGAPGSSWNTAKGATLDGAGTSNVDFHV